MNKNLVLALLLTSSTAFAGGHNWGTIAEQRERRSIENEALSQRIQESIYQQNMQQLQQEQNDILRRQADDYYFNNLRNNRHRANCQYSFQNC